MKKRSSIRGRTFCAALIFTFSALFPVLPGSVPGMTAAAEEIVSVQFEQPFAQKDEPLSVAVTGVEDTSVLTYRWTVDGVKQNVDGNSYTPAESDLEKMIQADVYAEDGTKLGSSKMYFSEIPVVYIETENQAPIVSKEDYLSADMQMQGSKNHSNGLYNGKIQIRGRGNATWGNPKKPYKIKLNSSSDIFGMGKSKHWVLLANYVDPSLLRNKLSYDFSGAMGMPYMQSVHVDVILNGSYIGNYQFCEQVKMEADRIPVEGFEDKVKAAAKAVSKAEGVDKDALEDAMMENLEWVTSDEFNFGGTSYQVSDYYGPIDITGGYLLELDYYDDEVSQILTDSGKRVKFKNPEFAKTNSEIMKYVADYLNAFEDAIHAADFHTDYEGENIHYSELFDMDSLVRFWIVQEVFFNWDGMNNSNYMYKDAGGLMHMGPIWDMDLTAGSNDGTVKTDQWQTFGFSHWQHPDQWYRSITCDPYFIVQAYDYYHKIRDTLIADILKQIDELDSEMHISGRYNVRKWHSSYYTEYINKLKSWMEAHLAWMDAQFASPMTMIASLGKNGEYGYYPDTSIGITASEEKGEIQLEIKADAERAAVYINGKDAGIQTLSEGTVLLQADSSLLNQNGTLNTVQVFKVSEDGKKGASNFISFDSKAGTQVPEPDVLTGKVTVLGAPVTGAVLKADTVDFNDTAAAYQWMADETEIAGATGEYYLIPARMEGKKISVVVTGNTKIGRLISEPLKAVSRPPVPSDHLLIDQVYGGGGASGVPVSHSYIVIYNPTEEDIDLSEYRLGYLSNRSSSKAGSTAGEMVYLELSGEILAGTSFLIRGAKEDTSGAEVILEIDKYDLEWEGRIIDNKQYQAAIYKGETRIDAVSVNEEAAEGSPLCDPPGDEILSKNKCICRNAHMDTDDNQTDFNVINLSKAPKNILAAVKPERQPDKPEKLDPENPDPEKPDPENPNPDQPDLEKMDPKQEEKPAQQDDSAAKKNLLNVSSLKLQKGQTAKVLKLKETAAAGDKVVRWKSSNPQIVKVSAKTGKMTGKKTGKAVITAVLKSGAAVSCNINVIKKPVATKSIALAKSSVTLKKGKTYTIKIKNRQPLTANDKLTYKSADDKIAAVSAKGKVTAKNIGKTIITVKTASGRKKLVQIQVRL